MPEEQTFAIRLPDGTRCNWTIAEIMAYHDSWQAELCQGQEQPMEPEVKVNLVNPDGTPFIPPLYKIEGGVVYREPDQHSGDVIRAIVREELEKLIPRITEQVGIRMAREARMHESVRKK